MPEKKGIIPAVQINQIKKIRRYIVDIKDILKKCDHTLLRVDCTSDEIRKLCDQAIKYNCASVCIPPCHVAGARRYVGDKLTICTVIGFPQRLHAPRRQGV